MKLNKINKLLKSKIKIGSIVKLKDEKLFTSVLSIKNNRVGGWWVFKPENCFKVDVSNIGRYEKIEDVILLN